MAPERDASQGAPHPLTLEGAPHMAMDGPERRRQRPQEPPAQQAHYSGKKKTHTDKNILLVNERTRNVVYLGPTEPGKTHDKKATEQAPIAYPRNAPLDKDPGVPGYEPERILTMQPKKSHEARP
jgi:DDE superfamily endonuclease